MEKDNGLKIREKPYHTYEEQLLYYKIAIDEAVKRGDEDMANYFRAILNLVVKGKDSSINFANKLINNKK